MSMNEDGQFEIPENEEQTVETNTDPVETNEQQPEEPKTFNPDDMEFESEHNFSGYDLSEWKESIGDDEESVQALESYTAKFQELGLSQEQVQGIVGFMVESGTQAESPETIRTQLNKQLTYEEKKSYKANCNLLNQALKGTPEEQLFNGIASNPGAIKVLTRVIDYMKGGKSINGIKERETRTFKAISGTEAVNVFTTFLKENLGKGADLKGKAKELRGQLATDEDKKYFNDIITY